MWGLILFFAWTALEILFVVAIIAWGFETGQWKDIEEPKYRMLVDLELQPWPGRDKPKGEKPAAQVVKH
jgi:hypothetical protein